MKIKIYNRQEFMKLPEGVIFSSGEPYAFMDMFIKGETWDFTGSGSSYWDFPVYGMTSSDHIKAWAYASEFKRPSFIHHDNHWGKEK